MIRTRNWKPAIGHSGKSFVVSEADTNVVWSITAEEEDAIRRATSLAMVFGRKMTVEEYDKTGRIVSTTHICAIMEGVARPSQFSPKLAQAYEEVLSWHLVDGSLKSATN